ncbi:hypothetical protein [Coleofasciculus sp. FACHB-1120]|uniref:hypothetical protein n=1 Tax=Coleofasciculus sp. FACHB-1120 TaxID=2692783 RepID=UPI001684511D|nr:hypothetical protein [Coleofasciculus sp. FACHB-1120]MBD2743687.1 hypothetical protein [Coleofasciculus sp. FACHB-1120]
MENIQTVTDEFLCNLAEHYVLKKYAPGEMIYSWEESHDTTNQIAEDYIDSCKVVNAKVTERNDEIQEYAVEVTTDIIIITEGNSDDNEAKNLEKIVIQCEIAADFLTKELFVENAYEDG